MSRRRKKPNFIKVNGLCLFHFACYQLISHKEVENIYQFDICVSLAVKRRHPPNFHVALKDVLQIVLP